MASRGYAGAPCFAAPCELGYLVPALSGGVREAKSRSGMSDFVVGFLAAGLPGAQKH